MINMKNYDVRKINGIAILLAIEIVLQTIGNFITLGPISINLSLIPIALAAIMYGPWAGALLGLVNGVAVMLAPSTAAFWGFSVAGTLITCTLKCTLAGFVSGLVFRLLEKKNTLIAVIVASLLVPLINTGLFVASVFTIFFGLTKEWNGGTENIAKFVFLTLIGINFIFEFTITTVLSPTLHRIIKIIKKEKEL